MSTLTELLRYDFLRQALLAGLLASILCGIVGTLVVVKRMVSQTGGIAHAVFGGLGAALYFGFDPRLGALIAGVLAAVAISLAARSRGLSTDAVTGILWAAGMAIGIVFLQRTPGYAPDLSAYLFGSLLTVQAGDVRWTALLAALVVVASIFYFKELVAFAADEDFARVQGIPVGIARVATIGAVTLTVVLLSQLVGIVLVLALLTIPAVIGLSLAQRFGAVVLLATAIGAFVTTSGLALSFQLDLPSGAAIVLVGVGLLALVKAARGVRHLETRRRRVSATPATDR